MICGLNQRRTADGHGRCLSLTLGGEYDVKGEDGPLVERLPMRRMNRICH